MKAGEDESYINGNGMDGNEIGDNDKQTTTTSLLYVIALCSYMTDLTAAHARLGGAGLLFMPLSLLLASGRRKAWQRSVAVARVVDPVGSMYIPCPV